MKLSTKRSCKQKPHYFYSTCPHPVILHVSREARSEAEKYYSLCFGACAESDDTVVISRPQIYVNPRADRICIMETRVESFPAALQDLMEQVDLIEPIYLALNTYADAEDFEYWVDCLAEYVDEFVLFHRYPPKSGKRGCAVFESLDHKYAPQSLPIAAQWAYQYILEQGHECEVSVLELK